MKGKSLWKEISHCPTTYPALKESIEVDILIIGGGITGITAANELLHAGLRVAIVEADKIGGVTTSMSTWNLYVAIQPLYQTVVSKFGLEHARKVAKSRLVAIDYIEKNVKDHHISCHFTRRPWYAYSTGEQLNTLLRELEVFRQMNVEVESVPELPFDIHCKKAFVIQNQARFNPLQYVISMAEELAKKKCLIYEDTRVLDIQEKDRVCHVITEHAKITAKKVFMATHTPIGINITQQFTAPYRSYVVAVELEAKDHFDAQLWHFDAPSYSLCTHAYKTNNPELFMVAGSHHKTGQGENMKKHFALIEQFIKKKGFKEPIAFQWSAQHYHSADSLPYIGLAHRHSKRVYMATGYFADGLVYGTIAGGVIAGLLMREDNTQKEVYKANRFMPFASMPFLVKENTNVLMQYAKDLPLPQEQQFDDIKAGEGRVVEIKRQKYAVCRDEKEQLHVVCAVCPHMKCIVNWNNAEKTWDCPCHGSRFTARGEVIEGPATTNLTQYKNNKFEEH